MSAIYEDPDDYYERIRDEAIADADALAAEGDLMRKTRLENGS